MGALQRRHKSAGGRGCQPCRYYWPMSDTPAPAVPETTPVRTWLTSLRVYLEPASLRMLALGFSAGLPFLLVFGTLSFWLREAGKIGRAHV